ncbi:MAG TPA: LPS export ABC transporter permease LptF [Alphaproteobacteria bacterium]|nr:LPS export ABC transporter permease LptF [Alphaproteobacteria bacterium]
MNRLQRYLLRQLVVATVFVAVVLTLAIWVTQSLRFFELLVDGSAPPSLFLSIVLLTVPTFLPIVLPVALLIGVLFTYNRLLIDSELVVMRAVGLSQASLAWPAVLLALAMTVGLYGLRLYGSPAAYREIVAMRAVAGSQYSAASLREGTFNELGDTITVYVRERDREGTLHGILVHDARNPALPATVMADRGSVQITERGPQVLVFDGNRQEVDPKTGRSNILYFDRYTIDLAVLKPETAGREAEPRERPLGDLLAAEEPRLRTELHERLSAPLNVAAYAALAIGAMLGGTFNRRGRSRRIAAAVLGAVAFQGAVLALQNLAVRTPGVWPVLYVVPLVGTAGALAAFGLLRPRRGLRPARAEC